MSSSHTSLQNQYRDLITRKNFVELARLVEKNENFPPAENIVRVGFKTYLQEAAGNRVKLFYLMKLKEITSIKPDDGVLKEACKIALEMDSPQVLEAFVKRTETGQSVFRDMAAILQKTYDEYVGQGRFMDISQLMEITGTSPSEENIQQGYQAYLVEAKFISFTGLRKRTGVQPEESMVAEIYNLYYSNYLKHNGRSEEEAEKWFGRLRKLKRITKIDPPDDINLEEPELEDEPIPAEPETV
ncbi:MAG: hypothetical protein GY950_35025 [bacterium]|nr:hypothetical protein [bacterium]